MGGGRAQFVPLDTPTICWYNVEPSAQSDQSLRMCLLQPPGYPKWNKRDPLTYWIDVQADLSLCWWYRSYCKFCRALAELRKIMGKFSSSASNTWKRSERKGACALFVTFPGNLHIFFHSHNAMNNISFLPVAVYWWCVFSEMVFVY